jgi:hypothetical protein
LESKNVFLDSKTEFFHSLVSVGSQLQKVVRKMMRLVMEAVMVIAVVSGMVFMMKVNAGDDRPRDTSGDNDEVKKDS